MRKIILFLFISSLSYAFNLTPLSQSIILGKNKNTVIYQVENKTKEPMALEMSVVQRLMGRDGKEKRPPAADGEFFLFPTQVILKPGQKRGIKVQWLGRKDIKNELNYRLLVEQLPINFQEKSANGIKMLLRYLGTLYISKSEFKPSISKIKWKKEDKHIKFIVKNSGSKHQLLADLKLRVKEKTGKATTIEGPKLKGFAGENILANSTREFKVSQSVFEKINLNKVSFEIEYE